MADNYSRFNLIMPAGMRQEVQKNAARLGTSEAALVKLGVSRILAEFQAEQRPRAGYEQTTRRRPG